MFAIINIDIGGSDNPVIRNSVSGLPYIPGSYMNFQKLIRLKYVSIVDIKILMKQIIIIMTT